MDSTAHSSMNAPKPTVSTWQHSNTPLDPQTLASDTISQVEFYFSDVNLPSDAHLLALAGGDGNGPVHQRDVLSFKRMRAFGPWATVRAALEQSEQLEIVNEQFIKRRFPLTVPLRVKPRADHAKTRKGLAAQDPTYFKNMLKPTGFEPDANQGPVTPLEYDADRVAFDPHEPFTFRMENAVNRYSARRKMHQDTSLVFSRFLNYGGFESGRQFTGGSTKNQLMKDGVDDDEISRLTAHFSVTPAVYDEYIENEDAADQKTVESKWVVDFEGVAKGFLSDRFMTGWDWYGEKNIAVVTNVLRNFYGYLLQHEVCMEYQEEIRKAQDVCDTAKNEFSHLAAVDRRLPGDFNVACSTLFAGHFAGLYMSIDTSMGWTTTRDNIGMSKRDAHLVFVAAMTAYGSDEQCSRLKDCDSIRVMSSEVVGLEVVKIELVTDAARKFYDDPKIRNTVIRPVGKLICKYWRLPNQAPCDLPGWKIRDDEKREKSGALLAFLLDDDTLKHCYPGLKMEATVSLLDIGVAWIDRVDRTFPSFFALLPNGIIAQYKSPGPPKPWMLKANLKAGRKTDAEQSDLATQDGMDDEDEYDEEDSE